jgi:hypothetical protein
VLTIVVRVLVVLFLVRLGVRLFVAARERRRPPSAGNELVRDRVCNTFVPRDRALFGVIAGRTEPFCSEKCRDRAFALDGAVPS